MGKRKNIVKDKSFNFSLRIIKMFKYLHGNHEYVMSRQVLRSGTSIGAMIRESEHAESKADFIHKLAIAQKEANETGYWLELLYKSDYLEQDNFESIYNDLEEIQKLISSIIITTKTNLRSV
jgi:four helix bundle protein